MPYPQYSFIKHEPTIISGMVFTYPTVPLHEIYDKYDHTLKQAVRLGEWANERHLFALSLLSIDQSLVTCPSDTVQQG